MPPKPAIRSNGIARRFPKRPRRNRHDFRGRPSASRMPKNSFTWPTTSPAYGGMTRSVATPGTRPAPRGRGTLSRWNSTASSVLGRHPCGFSLSPHCLRAVFAN